jgi:hypothetical protein
LATLHPQTSQKKARTISEDIEDGEELGDGIEECDGQRSAQDDLAPRNVQEILPAKEMITENEVV